MPDENENNETEETEETGATEEVEQVEDAAPAAEAEEPAAEPEAEEAAVEPEVADEPEAEPIAAEVEASEEPADEPADEGEPEDAESDEGAESPAAVVSEPKRKKKRLPRPERRQRPKTKHVKPAERKPITRLEKPEHVRGRRQERQGTVVSAAADKTIVVRVDVVKVHPRYKKVIKRSTRLHAHDEQNEAKLGDVVRIVETRPLSRLKRWRLREIVEAAK
jgi:small subunit ribosomal protein S17